MSAYEIKRATGLDPANTGNVALNAAGVYPVTNVTQPYNTGLYDVALTYTINGTNADQTWTPTAKTLATAVTSGVSTRIASISARLATLRECSGYGGRILLAAASQLLADRASRFSGWVTRYQTTITELDTDLTAVEGAANVDAINDIVSPCLGHLRSGTGRSEPSEPPCW